MKSRNFAHNHPAPEGFAPWQNIIPSIPISTRGSPAPAVRRRGFGFPGFRFSDVRRTGRTVEIQAAPAVSGGPGEPEPRADGRIGLRGSLQDEQALPMEHRGSRGQEFRHLPGVVVGRVGQDQVEGSTGRATPQGPAHRAFVDRASRSQAQITSGGAKSRRGKRVAFQKDDTGSAAAPCLEAQSAGSRIGIQNGRLDDLRAENGK